MSKALNATGRPILYSLCTWGEDYVHTVSFANSDLRAIESKTDILVSGECHWPTRGECLETSTILSRDRTHCVVVTILRIHIVLHQVCDYTLNYNYFH